VHVPTSKRAHTIMDDLNQLARCRLGPEVGLPWCMSYNRNAWEEEKR
jgi:hypothetical protein